MRFTANILVRNKTTLSKSTRSFYCRNQNMFSSQSSSAQANVNFHILGINFRTKLVGMKYLPLPPQ